MTARDLDTLSARLAAHEPKRLVIQNFRRAAVLVPLVQSEDGLSLLFTRRTESVETHKGQISFPGGVMDESDRDAIHTALRETEEEVGIGSSLVTTLGLLDDIATPIGFIITPVVGILDDLPVLTLSEVEVAEVFLTPLSFFADPGNGTVKYREAGGRRYEVWSYDTGRHVIWGATANIIRLLLGKLVA
ncbi:MAG: CoA pyrophosphatase [Ignavibacteria bacterium]|nr:CoA pyrophosphatase [Ignavibacteria bacterium]